MLMLRLMKNVYWLITNIKTIKMKRFLIIIIIMTPLFVAGQAKQRWERIKPISAQVELSTPAVGDLLLIGDSSDGDKSKALSIQNLVDFVENNLSSLGGSISAVTYSEDTLTITEEGTDWEVEITAGGGTDVIINTVDVSGTIVSVVYPNILPDNYDLKLRAYKTVYQDGDSIQINTGMKNLSQSTSGFSVEVKAGTEKLWYEILDVSEIVNHTFTNFGIQTLIGTNPTYDIENGHDARITLTGNTAINLVNAETSAKGVIKVYSAASSYQISFPGFDLDISDVFSHTETYLTIPSGVGNKSLVSWWWDGVELNINGGYGYE